MVTPTLLSMGGLHPASGYHICVLGWEVRSTPLMLVPECPAACAERRQYEIEMERLLVEHYSHPSIVIYVVFNEGWGQYEVRAVPLER